MRTKKSFYNLLSLMIPQIIIAFLAIFRTKYFLSSLGDEVYGIYQLFGQILAYLSLADFGITEAVNFYLYTPISEGNTKKISSILNGARRVFIKIMLIMLAIGIIISPFTKFFMKGTTVSYLFIIMAFIFLLISYILNYLSAPYTIMFDASQERYKYNIFTQSLMIIRYIFEIALALIFKNLFVIIITEISFTLIQNVIIRLLFKKYYQNIDRKIEPDYTFKNKLKSLLPHKISSLINNNVDIILISSLLGVSHIPIYTCNYYIINMISQIVDKINLSTNASVGNLIATKDKHIFSIFLEFSSLVFMLASIICVPLLFMITPFIKIWYGTNYTVSFITTIFFILILFYNIIRIPLYNFANGAGLYKETLICTIPEAIINLALSIILIPKLGILGVIIGTFTSLILTEFILKPSILNKYIFHDYIYKYYLDALKYIFIFIINCFLIYFIFKYLPYNNLFIWFVSGVILFSLNFVLINIEYKIINKNYLWSRLKLLIMQIFKKEVM